ncbi:MAG TPA: acyl-ACP--UDP-N-acetylglucosamine O-acyltransferase [Acidobacteriota bacterium]|jgi:UDP-N-acetylglucosamine acyltransferase
MKTDVLIHPAALVSAEAHLEAGVCVGPFAVIEGKTRIGSGSQIGAHAVIKRFTSIGRDNRIHEHVILGGEPQDVHFQGEESRLEIGDNNIIREGVTIHRATGKDQATRVGDDNFLMGYAHLAHNCEISDHVTVANNGTLAGHVRLESGAFISGGVVIHQYCRIGRIAMVGGNSKIVQDVLPFFITDGVPGRVRGVNVVGLRRAGIRASQLKVLKEAYHILLTRGMPLEEALEKMSQLDEPLVKELIAFARASERGFCHAERRGDEAANGAE